MDSLFFLGVFLGVLLLGAAHWLSLRKRKRDGDVPQERDWRIALVGLCAFVVLFVAFGFVKPFDWIFVDLHGNTFWTDVGQLRNENNTMIRFIFLQSALWPVLGKLCFLVPVSAMGATVICHLAAKLIIGASSRAKRTVRCNVPTSPTSSLPDEDESSSKNNFHITGDPGTSISGDSIPFEDWHP